MSDTIKIVVGSQTAKARQALADVQRRIDAAADAAARGVPKVEKFGDAVDDAGDASLRAAPKHLADAKAIHEVGDEASKAERKVRRLAVTGGRRGGLMAMFGITGRLAGLFRLALIPTILDAISALATLGSAAGAAGMAAIGALAPIVGVAGAIPGALAAAAAGFGAVALSTKRLGRELKGLKAPWRDLRRDVADATVPRLADAIKSLATDYLPILRRGLRDAGRAMGFAAQQAAGFLGQRATKRQVSGILGESAPLIRTLSGAGVAALRLLLNVMTAAAPMLRRMAADFTTWMQALAMKSTVGGDGLRDFFDTAYEVFGKVTDFVVDLTVALTNVARLGTTLGSEMGASFGGMAARFRDFTESAAGVERIKGWFAEMKPIIWEVGYLVRDISKGLASLSMDGSVVTTLRNLRLEFLPNILDMLRAASGNFLEPFSRAVGAVLNIITNLMVLPGLLDMIATSLDAIATVITSLPGPLATIASLALTLSALFRVSGLFGFLGGLGGGGKHGKVGGLIGGAKTGLSAIGRGVTAAAANTAFAFRAWKDGALSAGRATGMLARTTAGALAPALGSVASFFAGAGPYALAAGMIAGVGVAAMMSGAAIDEMRESARQLGDELRKTGSSSSLAALGDQIDTLKNDLRSALSQDESGGGGGMAFWGNSDMWGDAGRWLGAQVKQNWGDLLMGNPFGFLTTGFADYDSAAEQIQGIIDQQEALRSAQLAFTGETAFNLGTTGQVVQDILDVVGTDLPEGWQQTAAGTAEATRRVTEYYNVNYKAVPVVRDLYNGISAVSDATLTATQRAEGYASGLAALNALQGGGGGVTDTAVQAAKAVTGVGDAAKGASEWVGKGAKSFQKWATQQRNWDLYGTLQGAARGVSEHATAVLADTGSVVKANAAYTEQYRTLVGQVAKGMDISWEKAKRLTDQMMATPKEVEVAFRDEGLRDLIEQGASAKDLLNYIDRMVINPKVGKRWQTKAFNYSAWQSQVPGWAGVPGQARTTNQGASIPVKAPGVGRVIESLNKVQELLGVVEGPTTVGIDRTEVTTSKTSVDALYDSLVAVTKDPWVVRLGVDTKRREGGPVWPGRWTVGEVGPELFVPLAGGSPYLVGVTGQEQRTFDQSGWVIPNDQLPSTVTRRGGTRDTQPVALPPVTVGPVYAQSDVDLERAVARGIAAAERNRRERGYR